MGKRISLYKVFKEFEALDDLGENEEFKHHALKLICELDSVSAHTGATTVEELLWYWMIEHELTVYDMGKPVEEVTDACLYPDGRTASIETAERALLESWKLDSQELINKLEIEGFDIPAFLLDKQSNLQSKLDRKNMHGYAMKPKNMLDIECQEATQFITLPFFLNALEFSELNKGSQLQSVFFRLMDMGLPLRFSEPGYCFDDEKIHKSDVKCAMSRIEDALFDTDTPRMKLFAKEMIKTESGNELSMAGILVGREDVRSLYAQLGFDSYPWVKVPWPENASDYADYPTEDKKSESRSVQHESASQPESLGNDDADIKSSITPSLTKLEKQQNAILAVCKIKKYKPLAIPDGGKGILKVICEADYPDIFDGETSFDNAWKASKTLFRMANHASYAKRGNDL